VGRETDQILERERVGLMGYNFPDVPTEGLEYTPSGGVTYVYNAPVWKVKPTVYAASFDAMAYSGMQINGSCEVNQAGVSAAVSGNYFCDGWLLAFSGIPGSTATQDTAAPLPGLPGRFYLFTGTAKPSLSATDFLFAVQKIEGYRVSRLGWGTASAQPITIGFWTEHTLPGVYSISVRNSASNRSYVTTYTQNVASALEYKTVTLPGDTTGTWLTTNASGIEIGFTAACGTTYIAPSANTWTAGNYLAASGQVNVAAATTNFMLLRGVVVLPGTQAPTAAQSPLIMRPFDQELVTCQRYWQKTYPLANSPGALTNSGAVVNFAGAAFASRPFLQWYFPNRMRATPTMYSYSPVTGAATMAANINASVDVGVSSFVVSDIDYSTTPNTTPTAGHAFVIHYVADARL
jgi:hypothetical protein